MKQTRERVAVPISEEDEDSVYFREAREHFVEDDVLNTQDDGFMQGYETGFPETDEPEGRAGEDYDFEGVA